ncbi:winged helix-turn-helix domain-containing protein [Nocardia thailandica]|uniref:winged helix-turn-helix domain-containing protein n=1 Tax=Nocardia thailandica TaxID=257275 RepID=UPI0002E1638C|nr:winged helix-turn-helix domain-containing protein [Nocardia thailandica]
MTALENVDSSGDLTRCQSWILTALVRHGDGGRMTADDLAGRLGHSVPHTARYLQQLCAMGLVREHTDDGGAAWGPSSDGLTLGTVA